jgi:hypothetical protein
VDGVTVRETEVVHEECDIKQSSAVKSDANGDGKPDLTIVRSGGREVCRAVDLNFDGVVDAWSYFEPNGQLRRREHDYDRDGQIDEIAIYRGGAISEKHQSTSTARRLDTWDFYKNGQLARSERDSNGDGKIDQWWEYPRAGCPLIHADLNHDGRPDPGATVDYCKETGYVPPERADAKAPESPNFEQSGALPTEVENKDPNKDANKPADPAKGGTGSEKAPATKPAESKPAGGGTGTTGTKGDGK